MISRRRFLTGVAIGLAPIGAAAHAQEYKAQQSGTVRRIGVMGGGTPEYIEARKEGLRLLGWVEGQNILVEQIPVGNKSSAQWHPIT